MRYDAMKIESLQYMDRNQSAPSPEPAPSAQTPASQQQQQQQQLQQQQQQQQPSSHSSSPPQVMWPPHSQSSYEINDATSSSQFSEEGQQQVEYPTESSRAVEEYSPSAYPDRYQQASPINSGPMIRTMSSYEQGPGQGSPFSPQPSTSTGSYQVSMQNYERISSVEDYPSSAVSAEESLHHQYETVSQMAEQNEQVSSAVRLNQVLPSQSHVSLSSGRVDSPSTIDRGPSPSVSLQSQRIPSPMTTMAGQRMSSRYLSSDMVDSSIAGMPLANHQKDLLAEAIARNMVPNHVLNLPQSQRIPSPVNMIVTQSQRISSPSSMDFGGLMNRNLSNLQGVGMNPSPRSMSPGVQSGQQRYSPVHLRPMQPSSPMMPATPLAMQNYVSSSTGPMESGPSSSMVSSGAVLDSTVDSTVETTDSQLGVSDEVVGSSNNAYMADLDGGDGTIDTTQAHLAMSDAIDTTDGIDTTVNTTTLDSSTNIGLTTPNNFYFFKSNKNEH
uniref:Uncharacterized protein n=1 Tax=Strigamia maritima TaxID=126957 RepID=T1JKN8_STRMM